MFHPLHVAENKGGIKAGLCQLGMIRQHRLGAPRVGQRRIHERRHQTLKIKCGLR